MSTPTLLAQHLVLATNSAPASLPAVLPQWLGNASSARRQALKETIPLFADWHIDTRRQQQAPLKLAVAASWEAQNRVDTALAALQTPEEFAAPLLQQALQRRFDVEADVAATYLRLYTPLHTPLLPIPSGAVKTWTVSLVQAALHNFDAAEAEQDAYTWDSTFITQASDSGQLSTLPHLKAKIGIAPFIKLCRELDIGKQYQGYLKRFLGFEDAVLKAALRNKVTQSFKADARAALHMARLKKDVSDSVFHLLDRQLEGLEGMMLEGKPLLSHDLSLMGAPLTGIVLFAADLELHRTAVPMVAYIPGDPQSPLKYYADGMAFMQDLTGKLRSADYQQFFSRFVSHEHRGYFLADLGSRLSQVVWHQHTPGDPRPSWRDQSRAKPNLQFFATKTQGDLFEHLYEAKLNKLLNDARTSAVPTADADSKARWQRWESLKRIGETLLEIAAFIATPLVPPLGALMLGYTAYQLLDETFEGIVDWAEGLKKQALGHLMSITEQMLQLGMFVVGAPIAEGLLRQALPKALWDFFDRLKPVTSDDGKTRLWNPDLQPYSHNVQLATESRPNDEGLHGHQDKQLLPRDGQYFAVEQQSGNAFLQHPTRAHAYKPRIIGNGKGAWVTELDQPLTWDRATLLRRLGPPADGLSDARLEQALVISGTDEAALRKMYMDREPAPPLLADTLKRVNIDQQLQDFIDQMNSDDPGQYQQADHQTQLWLLSQTALWPESKTLRLLNAKGETVWEHQGRSDAAVAQIHEAQIKNGDLLKTLLETLDETERKTLLEEEFGGPSLQLHVRAATLRKKLARQAQEKRASLFDARYRGLELARDARVQKIIDTAPGLPTSAAEEVLRTATGQELLEIDQGTLPTRLIDRARWAAHEVRVNRALEGLHMDALENNDTHRLALHSLENLPGWSAQVRIEITDFSRTGKVRDTIGSPQATIPRVLVRTIQGDFIPEDDRGALLAQTDFYTAVLQALPDAQRDALGIHIGQGPLLRQTLLEHALPREALSKLLAEVPVRKPSFDPRKMRLPGGMEGYDATQPAPGSSGQEVLESQLLHELYPNLRPDQVAEALAFLRTQTTPALRRLQHLQQEFLQLEANLSAWHLNPPRTLLGTQLPINTDLIIAEQQNRWHWKQQLIRAWRHETPADHYNPDARGNMLDLTWPIYGELPPLNANFPAITYLELSGYPGTQGVPGFLARFANLRGVNIRDIKLTTLPNELTPLAHLNELTLRNCSLRLTEQSRTSLGALRELKTLDLSNNPLALAPNVEHMAHLQRLNLSQTGISQFPAGLVDRPRLVHANLSDNALQALPDALFSLSSEDARAFDLTGNPLARPALEKVKTYCQSTGEHFGVDAEVGERRLVHQLYPSFTDREASRFIFGLPGSLDEALPQLVHLKADYERLQTDLEQWAVDVPQQHPRTNAPLEQQAQAQQQVLRQQFKSLLEACWRRETPLDTTRTAPADTHELVSTLPILGDLPQLNIEFNHVSKLDMKGEETTSIPVGFLKCLPNLESLLIHRYALPDIPYEIFQLPKLKTLSLSQSHIRLTPTSADALSGLENLEYLDLSDNLLGITPDVSKMPRLTTLMLENAGLTQAPHGTFNLRSLSQLNLSDNQITELPSDIIEVDPELADDFDLSGNPFTPTTLIMLHRYYNRTAVSFGVPEARHLPAHIPDPGLSTESSETDVDE
ncbi:leucine-rich repeat domain-containing protein [Pseudomonas fluorescens]|uniref:leucine-rich repeat domain-containing protein n=1 Tax=Pseudomonas fluorescens TaxID=294 RepID=UPI000935B7EC|nr:leucine-rich repeat domain-containing protein [Pseudomonas fluorescens]